MTSQGKGVARLIAGILANTAVIGLGLAIYDDRLEAATAGISAMILAAIITWRIEK